jgi:membrane fusion protein (multidrug efflux system)
VRALGARSHPATRSYPVEIEIPNPDATLLSGMAARAGVVIEERQSVITVPAPAIVEQYGAPVVFVVREGRAERRTVTLGPRAGDRVVVEAGLAAGEALIVRGQWSVSDGMAVEVQQ